MNIKNRLTAGLLMAALLSLFGTAAWADDDGNFRAGPLKVVTQNLYVGGDILLPLSVPPEDFPAAAAEVIDQILATNYPERAMKLSDLLRHEWPHLVGLQEVYEVKICLDPAQTQCLLDQDYLEILLENLNEQVESYREVATVTNIDLQNLPAALPTGELRGGIARGQSAVAARIQRAARLRDGGRRRPRQGIPVRQHAPGGHGQRV
jgi:hypothetical protein